MVWDGIVARRQPQPNPEKSLAADRHVGLLHVLYEGLDEAESNAQPLSGSLGSFRHAIAK